MVRRWLSLPLVTSVVPTLLCGCTQIGVGDHEGTAITAAERGRTCRSHRRVILRRRRDIALASGEPVVLRRRRWHGCLQAARGEAIGNAFAMSCLVTRA